MLFYEGHFWEAVGDKPSFLHAFIKVLVLV